MGFEFKKQDEMKLSDKAIRDKLNSEDFKLQKTQRWAKEHGFDFKTFSHKVEKRKEKKVSPTTQHDRGLKK
jgi:hypothetical protein